MKRLVTLVSAISAAWLAAAGPAAAQTPPYDAWNPSFEGLAPGTPDSPRANCAGGSADCINRTLGEMWWRFHRYVPRCNHNAIFSLTYIRVTQDVRDAIDQGLYEHERWIRRQDAIFARMYFDTYTNWREGRIEYVPESWRIAFGAADDEAVEGIGNLLLSMNAHINRDFPFALYHAGVYNRDGSSRRDEHDLYNARLRALYRPMLDELARRFDESINDYDIPGMVADDDAFFEILVQWRDEAWRNAVRLADAGSDAERRAIAGDIEQYANGIAQLILAGSSYGPGEGPAGRNARCAEHGGQRGPGYPRGAELAEHNAPVFLSGRRLRVVVSCAAEAIGHCAGSVAVRLPRSRGGQRQFRLLGRRRFALEPAIGRYFTLRLPPQAARLLRDHPRRGVWVALRSKRSPGEATTVRHRIDVEVRR